MINNTESLNKIKNEVIELNLLNCEAIERLEESIREYSESIELIINVPDEGLSKDIKQVL